jgi:hypothetical protein
MAMLPSLPAPAQQAILSEVGVVGRHAAPPLDATQPIEPERERPQTQTGNLAGERDPAQFQAGDDTAVLEEQDEPGRWPRDWPGGGG